jgi:hypothetical protein
MNKSKIYFGAAVISGVLTVVSTIKMASYDSKLNNELSTKYLSGNVVSIDISSKLPSGEYITYEQASDSLDKKVQEAKLNLQNELALTKENEPIIKAKEELARKYSDNSVLYFLGFIGGLCLTGVFTVRSLEEKQKNKQFAQNFVQCEYNYSAGKQNYDNNVIKPGQTRQTK